MQFINEYLDRDTSSIVLDYLVGTKKSIIKKKNLCISTIKYMANENSLSRCNFEAEFYNLYCYNCHKIFKKMNNKYNIQYIFVHKHITSPVNIIPGHGYQLHVKMCIKCGNMRCFLCNREDNVRYIRTINGSQESICVTCHETPYMLCD